MGQGSGVAGSYGVGPAPIRALAWKLPCAVGVALKSKQTKKRSTFSFRLYGLAEVKGWKPFMFVTYLQGNTTAFFLIQV